jgi:type I restriction enzyme, R subunit
MVQGGEWARASNTRLPLGSAEIDRKIVERYYQERAIRRIGEAFEKDYERKALVVMATGAGKTRAVVALCDLMMRCNWVKRVLFLADRIALVKQTTNVFKKFLPSASAVNVLERPEEIAGARTCERSPVPSKRRPASPWCAQSWS